MSQSPPIRVAVIGLGWAARSIWLPRLSRHPAFTVAAVVDPDPAARASVQPGGTGARVLADVDGLGPDLVDLAVVAVPNHLHSAIACRLLSRDVSVFVEKPVCLTSAEADQLAAAEQGGRGVLLAGSAARYRADVQALYAAAERLGELRHVEASWVRARGVPSTVGWFTQRRLSGGGALVDLGWHLLDAIAPLLGPASFTEAVATTSGDFITDGSAAAAWREEGPAPSSGAGDVEDTVRGFLVTDAGTSIFLHASWASHEPLDVTRIRVEGSNGTACLQCTFGFSPNRLDRSSLRHTRRGKTIAVPLPDEPIGAEYDRQLDALPSLLADPASKGRAVEESRRTVAAIERLYGSARRSRSSRCLPQPRVPA